MGMFDYIRCKMPLPEGAPFHVDATTQFQTKDLENLMWQFIIQADGSLVYEEQKAVEHEPNPDNKWDFGYHIEQTGKLIPYHGPYGLYHGRIDFYTTELREGGYVFAEFLATISHGKVESIERLPERR